MAIAGTIGGAVMSLVLTSSAFNDRAEMPRRYTCEGENVSPPLAWSGAPEGTRSFALIVDDPDAPDPNAPKLTWVHWVLYNIPATASELPEAVRRGALPKGTQEGLNDWKKQGYGGPCPPIGRHRYFHRLHALDTMFSDLHTPTKVQLEKALSGHVLDRADLVGTYQKTGR
jgi:Raf kinase inhibitor-like YbhB/YbcL family protein